jgi:hypothetical protein
MKLLDKLYSKKYYEYMKATEQWSVDQHAYSRNRSTQTALFDIISNIESGLSNEEYVLLICIDCSKAFDTVPSEGLLSKLSKYGIQGRELAFAKHYLTNRTQVGLVNGCTSEERTQLTGCPQGGNFSCMSFISFNNDLPKALKEAKVVMYSDDTSIILHHKNLNKLKELANDTLDRVDKWYRFNRLTLNKQKTNFILYEPTGKRGKNPDFQLQLNNTPLQRISANNCTKLLGIHFDDKCSYKTHIKKVIQKIKSACYALNCTKNILRKKERLCVYRSLIESHLRYGIIFWGPKTTKEEAKTILKLQKRALRNVELTRYNAHTGPIFYKHNLLKFADLMKWEQIMWTYKCVMGIYPDHITRPLMADLSTTDITLRSQSSRALPRNSKETLLTTSLRKTWNSLDETIRSTTSLDTLKWDVRSLTINLH